MKNIKCIYPVLVICICFLVSCKQQNSEKRFFDVPGYFRGEIDYIKKNISAVKKTSVYNGDISIDELKVADLNWEKEFAVFLETDINKPSYYANMIQEKVTIYEKVLHGVSYKDRSGKLNIRELEVQYADPMEDKNPVYIKVISRKSNLISNTTITAIYLHNSYYQIWGEQKIKNLGETNTFSVKGEFN